MVSSRKFKGQPKGHSSGRKVGNAKQLNVRANICAKAIFDISNKRNQPITMSWVTQAARISHVPVEEVKKI